MNIYSIYKATNNINNKVYIGFDSNWPSRKNYHHYIHCNDENPLQIFYRALKKHGWDAFQWEVIYQSYDGTHTLKIMESFFIKEYNSYVWFEKSNGYNMTLGGEGTLGMRYSKKSKQKRKENALAYHAGMTEEQKLMRATNCSIGQQKRFTTTSESSITKHKKKLAHQGHYLIVSPLGENFTTTEGLKEFALKNGDKLGVTYWQLFDAYRRGYKHVVTKRIRCDSNKWKVTRLDKC